MDDGHVRELIRARGGNWGSTSVDDKYLDFIKCLIGDSVARHLQQSQSTVLVEVCKEFEIAKRNISPKSDIKFQVRIPYELAEEYTKVYPGENLMSKDSVLTKRKKRVSISFVNNKLRLASEDAEHFFAKSVKKITHRLRDILQEIKKQITTLILVGGYADSQVLTKAIKSKFPEMRIIIPEEAAWSVLRGAIIFGHDSSLIKERRSKCTYGLMVFETFDPSKHDEKYKYTDGDEERCGNVFSKLLEKDEAVTVGEYQKERVFMLHKKVKHGDMKLYTSTEKNPKYVNENGCSFVGRILPPGHNFLLNETIHVMMRFGETEIEFKAHQPISNKTMVYYLGQ